MPTLAIFRSLRPSASMRHPGKSPKEDYHRELSRNAAYYLWVGIPLKLSLLGLVLYVVISGNNLPSWTPQVALGVTVGWVTIACTLIYGWRRTALAVPATLGLAVLSVWIFHQLVG